MLKVQAFRFSFLYYLICSGWFLVKLESLGRVQSELWRRLEEEEPQLLSSFQRGSTLCWGGFPD